MFTTVTVSIMFKSEPKDVLDKLEDILSPAVESGLVESWGSEDYWTDLDPEPRDTALLT